MAAAATNSRSAPISGPASAWCAAARGRRWSAIPKTVAARIKEYMAIGIDTFIMSGYPHLEEAYRFAELVFPLLPLAQERDVQPVPVNTGPFGETIANDYRPRRQAGVAIMSAARDRRAGFSALTQWVLPLAILAIWQVLSRIGFIPVRVLPAPTEVLAAGWKLLLNGELGQEYLGQLLARHRRLCDRRRHRLRARAGQRSVAAFGDVSRHARCR